MKRPPIYWNKAKRILSRKDSVLRKIIKKYKRGYLSTRNNPYFSLCRTIVGQQISTKAADSIWSKFEKKCKNHITPKMVLKISSSNLKKAGLSRQKVTYLKIQILNPITCILVMGYVLGYQLFATQEDN